MGLFEIYSPYKVIQEKVSTPSKQTTIKPAKFGNKWNMHLCVLKGFGSRTRADEMRWGSRCFLFEVSISWFKVVTNIAETKKLWSESLIICWRQTKNNSIPFTLNWNTSLNISDSSARPAHKDMSSHKRWNWCRPAAVSHCSWLTELFKNLCNLSKLFKCQIW